MPFDGAGADVLDDAEAETDGEVASPGRRSTVKFSPLLFTSGGSTSMPSFEHSATAAAMRAWVSGELRVRRRTAVMYWTG